VAAFTVSGNGRVGCRSGFAGQTIAPRQMAGGALSRDRHIAVEGTWVPAAVPCLVAAVAVSDSHTGQGLVRNMVQRFAIGRWVGAAMAR
jgi:hypothetical protein